MLDENPVVGVTVIGGPEGHRELWVSRSLARSLGISLVKVSEDRPYVETLPIRSEQIVRVPVIELYGNYFAIWPKEEDVVEQRAAA